MDGSGAVALAVCASRLVFLSLCVRRWSQESGGGRRTRGGCAANPPLLGTAQLFRGAPFWVVAGRRTPCSPRSPWTRRRHHVIDRDLDASRKRSGQIGGERGREKELRGEQGADGCLPMALGWKREILHTLFCLYLLFREKYAPSAPPLLTRTAM